MRRTLGGWSSPPSCGPSRILLLSFCQQHHVPYWDLWFCNSSGKCLSRRVVSVNCSLTISPVPGQTSFLPNGKASGQWRPPACGEGKERLEGREARVHLLFPGAALLTEDPARPPALSLSACPFPSWVQVLNLDCPPRSLGSLAKWMHSSPAPSPPLAAAVAGQGGVQTLVFL